MKNYIQIKDSMNKHFLSVTLYDLLTKLEGKFNKYHWSVYELTAIARGNANLNILQLEKEIAESPTGLHLSWNELLKLANGLEQVINLILVASNKEEDFIRFEDHNRWRNKFFLVIEIIDGDCWEVYSRDSELIKFLSKIYQNVKIVKEQV